MVNLNLRKGFKNKKDDYYATPKPLIRVLLDNIKKEKSDLFNNNNHFLDPCAGNGVIRDFLEKEYYYKKTKCYDINIRANGIFRKNFRDIDKDKHREDYIITNPPYNQLDEFLDFFKNFKYKFLLLRFNHLAVSYRVKYFQDVSGIITFNRQLDLSEWISNGEIIKSGGFAYCWVIWGLKLNKPFFLADINDIMFSKIKNKIKKGI